MGIPQDREYLGFRVYRYQNGVWGFLLRIFLVRNPILIIKALILASLGFTVGSL